MLKIELDISALKGNHDELLERGLILLTNNYRYSDFLKIKSIIPDKKWPIYYTKIEEKLLTAATNPRLNILLAQIYSDENKIDHLLSLLKKQDNLFLLDKHFSRIHEHNSEYAFLLSKHLIIKYANNHLGKPATDELLGFLMNTIEKGYTPFANKLGKFIVKNYKDRRSLISELQNANLS